MNKLLTKAAKLLLGLSLAAGVGVAIGSKAERTDAADTTYTFTSKAWADSTNSWTSDKDGGQLTSGQGVQVSTTYTGAGAHSKSSISNITNIEFTYCTNASKGAGSISVTIGSNSAETYSVTNSGGTTARTTSHTYSTAQSGVVTFTVSCTTNSIYVSSIKITTQDGGSFTPDHAGTSADPYSVADARGAIDANSGVTNVYTSGIVYHVNGYYSNKYITYWISDNGSGNYSNKDGLEVYNGLGLNGADFSSVDDIKEGDQVVVYGNLTKYVSTSTYEYNTGAILYSLVRKFTVTYDGNGADSGTAPTDSNKYLSGASVTVLGNTGSLSKTGYIFNGWTDGTNTYSADDTFNMPNDDVTLEAVWVVDSLQTLSISGSMTKTIYATSDSWSSAGLVVTATFLSGASSDVAAYATFTYYNSSDTVVATPNALGVGTNQTIKVTATYGGMTTSKYTASTTIEVYAGATYDFTQNFSTYASTWGGYAAQTISGSDLDAEYEASIVFANVSKQSGTITDRPVIAAKSGTNASMMFELNSSVSASYNITAVTVEFAYWSGKTVSASIYKGTTASGSALDSITTSSSALTLSVANLNGDAFFVEFTSTNSANQQLGISSITIGLSAKASFGTLHHISVTTMPETIYHVGEYFDPTGFKVTAYDGFDESTASYKDVTSSVVTELDNTYQFDDGDVPGFDTTVQYTEGGNTVETNYHIYVYALAEYKLVDSALTDWSGNYLIVSSYVDSGSNTHTVAINSAQAMFDTPLNFKEVSISGDTIEAGQECEFTFASYSGGYSIQGKNGKYAYGNSSSRFMTSDSQQSLSISIDSTTVTITGGASYYMRLNTATSGAERFGFYNKDGSNISLYKLVESSAASDFADEFLETLSTGADPVCKVTNEGIVQTDLDDLKVAWAILAVSYNSSLTNSEKEMFRVGVASENGTNIQQALALYDHIATVYGENLESQDCLEFDFMNRNIAPIGGARLALNNLTGNTNTIAAIVIISLVSVTAIGGYFFIKRKEEN